MQRKILVIGGILLITITIGLFLYVFFIQKAEDQVPTVSDSSFEVPTEETSFTPTEQDVVNVSDISDGTLGTASTSTEETISDDVFTPESHFTQLSTSRVAGMVFTSTTTVRFSERGTGEITDLNLRTMNTETISVNLSGVIATTFNNNGSRVLLKINDGLVLRFFAGVIAESARGGKELRGSFLPNNTQDATFTGETNIRYLLTTQSGGEIHAYEPSTRTDTFESKMPFTQAYFVTSAAGAIYLVTTPSAAMHGAIYRYTPRDSSITSLTRGGRGLTAFAAGDTIFVTAYHNKTLSTIATNGSSERVVQDILNTDTCIAAPLTIYCARPLEINTTEYPDRWYRGEEHHNDNIFELATDEQKLFSIADPQQETGQSFDILKLVAHPTRDDLLLLINKNNDTLWLYAR